MYRSTGDALRENTRSGQEAEAGGAERRWKACRRRLPVGSDPIEDAASVHPHGHARGFHIVSVVLVCWGTAIRTAVLLLWFGC